MMKKPYTHPANLICALLSFVFLLCISAKMSAQIPVTVTGNTNTTPNLAASYTSLALALTDLNLVTAMTGPVTLTLDAGASELAPVTGFTIGSATLNPVLNSTNTVTIIKAVGAATIINANVGVSTPSSAAPDGMLKVVGADYITIDGLTFTDGNGANPATMEFGVALFKLSLSDGAQNNTVQNCIFNMQRVNNASGSGPMVEGAVGINVVNSVPTAATTSLTPTTAAGTNSNNRFYTNTINGGNYGIVLNGFAATTPFTAGDFGNDIGGTASGTGNTILNFGGAAAATNPAAGIRANNQWGVNISYNTLNNNDGAGVNHVATFRGIFAQAGTSANATINNNTLSIQSGSATSACTAIDNGIGSTAASNTIAINGNTINIGYPTATTGIYTAITNSSSAATVNINNNVIGQIASVALAGTGTHVMIETGSPTTATANNNSITNISRNGASGSWRGIKTTSPTNLTVNSNTIDGLSWTAAASTGGIDAFYSFSSAVNVTVTNNIIRNLSTPTTGTINGIREFGVAGTKNIQNNQVYNFSTTSGGAGGATFNGIFCSTGTIDISNNQIYSLNSAGSSGGTGGVICGVQITGGTASNIYKNKIYDLSTTSTTTTSGAVNGVLITANTTNTIYNNLIGDLRATASGAADAIRGVSSTSTTTSSSINVYFNTIYLNATSSGTNFGTSGVFHTTNATATTATLNLRNNIIVNLSTANGTGVSAAYRRSSTTLTNYGSASNTNLFYAGTPGATKLIFYDGTNSDQNLADYKTRVTPRDASSITENPPFLSTTGSSANFLHIDPAIATQIESAGAAIGGITDDYDGQTRNVTTPDVGADEGTFTLADLNGPSIVYTPIANSCNTSAVTLSATITDASGVPTSGIGLPVLYWKINAGAYTAATAVHISGSNYEFTFGGGGMATDVISYYIVAQDNAGTPNVSAFPSTGASGFTANPPAVSTPPTTPSSYMLLTSLTGTYTVGAGGNYTTLTAAINDYNTKCLIGAVVFSLTDPSYSASETFPISINLNPSSNATNTLTIRPATGVAAVITGTGGASATALIRLNGAKYVTIDGVNTGGASLTIENTSITSGSAVIWLSSNGTGLGASNNTIQNCSIKAGVTQNTTTTNTYGIVIAGATLSGTFTSILAGNDNDNNAITGNTITKCRYAIHTRGGATTNPNLGTVISNNIIGPASFGTEEIGKGGIVTREEDGIQITNNEIRFVGGDFANTSGGADRVGISFGTDASWTPTSVFVKNAIVSRNKIHDIIEERTFSAAGIAIAAADGSNATNNSVFNNMLYNIKANGTSGDQAVGIGLSAGNGETVVYNSIYMTGDTDPNATATAPTTSNYGISIAGSSVTNPFIRNNIVWMDLTSSSTSTLKNASINIPTSYVWGTGSSNYNDLYAAPANTQANVGCVGGSGGTFHLTLAAWQGAVTQDALSISALPVFVSGTNLHLDPPFNEALNDLGNPIAGITTDIDLETRSVTTPDMGADEFTPPVCAGAVGGTAAVTGPSSFCGSGTPVITASGYSSGIGSGYQWMSSTVIGDYPLNGTPIAMQTNPASLLTGLVSTTTYYWLKVTCTSGQAVDYSTMVTITIVPLPTASISPSGTVNLCPPTSSQLLTSSTNASTPSYIWRKDGVILGGETNATYNATATGVYTVSITDGVTMCSNLSSPTSVIFNPAPMAPTVTPSSASKCEDDPAVLLTASGSTEVGSTTSSSGAISLPIPDVSSTGVNHSLSVAGIPGGSTIDSVIVTFNITHSFDQDIIVNLEAPNGQIVNLVKGTIITGGANFTNTRASSDATEPAFPATGAPFTSTYRADLATSGFQLTPVPAPTTGTFSTLFSIPNGTWKIRVYDDESIGTGTLTGWSIKVSYLSPASYTWTPNGMGSGLYTDSGASMVYNGEATPMVYSNPSGTTVYTVTATSGAGCTNTSTVTVTVNPTPTITLGTNPEVCSGILTADLTYSGTTGSPDEYSINFDAAAEAQGFVDVMNAMLPASPIVIVVPGAAVPGIYNANLTVRNSTTTCTSSSMPITVTVLSLPNAGTVTGLTPLCIAATTTYTSNGDAGGVWSSTNPSVASVDPMTGLVTALTVGTTDITYTASNTCGSPAMAFQTLTVDPIEVQNTNDSGAGSLRDIIACAGPGATITFAPALMGMTITLTTGEIVINKNLTLSGIGMLNLTISGNNASRIFHVQTGNTFRIEDMSLIDASAMTNGGALFVQGGLILENVILDNNLENGVPKALTIVNPALLEIIGTVEMRE